MLPGDPEKQAPKPEGAEPKPVLNAGDSAKPEEESGKKELSAEEKKQREKRDAERAQELEISRRYQAERLAERRIFLDINRLDHQPLEGEEPLPQNRGGRLEAALMGKLNDGVQTIKYKGMTGKEKMITVIVSEGSMRLSGDVPKNKEDFVDSFKTLIRAWGAGLGDDELTVGFDNVKDFKDIQPHEIEWMLLAAKGEHTRVKFDGPTVQKLADMKSKGGTQATYAQQLQDLCNDINADYNRENIANIEKKNVARHEYHQQTLTKATKAVTKAREAVEETIKDPNAVNQETLKTNLEKLKTTGEALNKCCVNSTRDLGSMGVAENRVTGYAEGIKPVRDESKKVEEVLAKVEPRANEDNKSLVTQVREGLAKRNTQLEAFEKEINFASKPPGERGKEIAGKANEIAAAIKEPETPGNDEAAKNVESKLALAEQMKENLLKVQREMAKPGFDKEAMDKAIDEGYKTVVALRALPNAKEEQVAMTINSLEKTLAKTVDHKDFMEWRMAPNDEVKAGLLKEQIDKTAVLVSDKPSIDTADSVKKIESDLALIESLQQRLGTNLLQINETQSDGLSKEGTDHLLAAAEILQNKHAASINAELASIKAQLGNLEAASQSKQGVVYDTLPTNEQMAAKAAASDKVVYSKLPDFSQKQQVAAPASAANIDATGKNTAMMDKAIEAEKTAKYKAQFEATIQKPPSLTGSEVESAKRVVDALQQRSDDANKRLLQTVEVLKQAAIVQEKKLAEQQTMSGPSRPRPS